jgi:putative ABC transport system ATP-binding protein
MSGTSVETSALEKTYLVGDESVCALDKVDLSIPASQFLLVRGRSGSGKTTLLQLIAGLLSPSSGSVRIGDTDVGVLSTRQADLFRRRNIGLVFQFFNLIPSLTVEMNVALPLLLEGRHLRHLRDEVDPLLEQLGIGSRRDHAPSQLSGGEQQRVAIARALVSRPRVILADEPTGNLDSKSAHEVWRMLRDQAEQRGVTTLVMTHELDATTYADRVIELGDGRILSDTGAGGARCDSPPPPSAGS